MSNAVCVYCVCVCVCVLWLSDTLFIFLLRLFCRPIIVFVAAHLPAAAVDLERVLLYLIVTMDNVVNRSYCLVWLHTNFSSSNQPNFQFIRKVYSIFTRKYKKNMKSLFVVHPTMWVKAMAWMVTPFVSSKFWRKFSYIERVSDLYSFFDATQLTLPDYVFRYDRQVNAGTYANADANSL